MKTILVPTDFSEEAARAYPLAANLALRFDANVKLLHILKHQVDDLARRWGGTFGIFEQAGEPLTANSAEHASAQIEIEKIAGLPVFDGVRVSASVNISNEEDPGKAIIDELNNNEYGLIVMGTHGDEKEGETFAEIIARHTITPLITTKSTTAGYEPKKIVIATDLETVTRGFIARAADIAHKYDGELHVLYVNTPKHFKSSADIQKEALKIRKKLRLPKFEVHEIAAYTVTEGIKSFLEGSDYDMIGLATHGRTGLSHYLYGSNTEDIINEVDIPVYTYNLSEFLKKYQGGEGYVGMSASYGGL